MKSHCSKKDKNVNLELTNKFEPLNALEPKIVSHLDKSVNPKASNKKRKKVLLLGSSHARGLTIGFTHSWGLSMLSLVYSDQMLDFAMSLQI
jgi:hypothetical protein